MARIIDEMLRESQAGVTTLIFDDTIESPTFQTAALFINKVEVLKRHLHKVTHYITCIGAEHGYARYMTSQCLEQLGLRPLSLIHRKSFAEKTASIGKACHLFPFSLVHKFARIDDHSILNTHCTIDHECVVGRGVHIMGSAAVAGCVTIGDFATVGTNATVLPGLKIGEGSYVGAGAVVTEDVKPHTVVVGVPARFHKSNRPVFREGALKALAS